SDTVRFLFKLPRAKRSSRRKKVEDRIGPRPRFVVQLAFPLPWVPIADARSRSPSVESELRRVDPKDDEALAPVLVGPRAQVRQRPLPVDARVRPEIDQHDLAAQLLGGQRLRVEPGDRA